MALTIRRTGASEYGSYLKVLICGDPGAGKTRSASTYPKPLIASIGANLMSVADRGTAYVEITSAADLLSLRNSLDNPPDVRAKILGVEVETIIIDTLDHFQQILQVERKRDEHKDTFAPADFGWLNDEMRSLLRGFRNLPMHVVFHLHLKVSEDMQTNQMYFRPSLQGALGDEVSAYVDVALAFKSGNTVVTAPDGTTTRVITRYAQTYRDAQHPWVRDNSGQLPPELEINFEDDFARLYAGVFGGKKLAASAVVKEVDEKAVAAVRQANIEASLAEPAPAAPAAPVAPPAAEAKPKAKPKAKAAKVVTDLAEAQALAAPPVAPAPPVPPVVDEAEDEEEAAVEEIEAALQVGLEAALSGDAEVSSNGSEAPIPAEDINTLPPCTDCGGVIETEDQADLSKIRFRRPMCRNCFVDAKQSLRAG